MIIEPSKLNPTESYRLMISVIVPRPIAFVSTINKEGVKNVAPFSAFGHLGSRPPIVCFSAGRREGEKKDTIRNIEYTRDFVINIVTEDIVDSMMIAAKEFPSNVSEIEEAKLTALDSVLVKSPRIAESPINLECKVIHIMEIGKSTTTIVLGEIVQFHIRDDILTDGKVDIMKLKPVGRLGGDLFCKINDIFVRRRIG